MRKFIALCRAGILVTLTYRIPLLVWNVGDLISLMTIVAVWLSVSANQTIGGYSKPELIQYYVSVLFLQWIVGWHVFYPVKEEIRDGSIILWLLKPFSYYWNKFSQELGWHIVSSIVGVLTVSVVVVLLGVKISLAIFSIKFLLILLAIILSCILCYTISLCLALICFWLTEVDGIYSLFFISMFIFGGQGIPLSFFPESLRWLVNNLPFRYLFSFPLEIYLNKITGFQISQAFIVGVIWIIFFGLIYKYSWKYGLKRFTAFGG